MTAQTESQIRSFSFWYNRLLSILFALFLLAFIAVILLLFFLSVKNEASAALLFNAADPAAGDELLP
jgi:lipopolysaccharide/colanic/teichoic acid biosynthesis glycosyltransferase